MGSNDRSVNHEGWLPGGAKIEILRNHVQGVIAKKGNKQVSSVKWLDYAEAKGLRKRTFSPRSPRRSIRNVRKTCKRSFFRAADEIVAWIESVENILGFPARPDMQKIVNRFACSRGGRLMLKRVPQTDGVTINQVRPSASGRHPSDESADRTCIALPAVSSYADNVHDANPFRANRFGSAGDACPCKTPEGEAEFTNSDLNAVPPVRVRRAYRSLSLARI